jgi:hypothetical protein
VIGNHLAQHAELSLLAIGLAVYIQSLPTGTHIGIKTLAKRFPEGTTRIASALRELEAHGYLRRVRERTPTGRIVTRTISCNQPTGTRRGTARPARIPHSQPEAPSDPGAPTPDPDVNRTPHPKPTAPRKQQPLAAVPQPAFAATALLRTAADLLTGLRLHDPRLLLSASDTAHLAPGVAAWLEREVPASTVQLALTSGLPPEGLRRPAALLAHRLTAQLPPLPPFRTPVAPLLMQHPLQNCDKCDHAFRAPEPGLCGGCRAALP